MNISPSPPTVQSLIIPAYPRFILAVMSPCLLVQLVRILCGTLSERSCVIIPFIDGLFHSRARPGFHNHTTSSASLNGSTSSASSSTSNLTTESIRATFTLPLQSAPAPMALLAFSFTSAFNRYVTVKTVHTCLPNFAVSCPAFECQMRRFGNRSQRFGAKCSNIPTECLSKSFKFHSRSLLVLEVFKRKFQDGRA